MLKDGVPSRVEVHHPTERLTLLASAEDEAGRIGHGSTGLPAP